MEYIPAKTIVTRNKSTAWFGCEYNMNIYKGCCHGCIYCDSRSECYRVEDFDRVRAKENALAVIRDDLRRKAKPGVVATGAMSDPYNPFEADLQLTRHALELINAYNFGVAIDTKSPLVTRDIDLLNEIREHSPVLVKMTVTAADDALCGQLEPNVAPTSQRFAAIKELAHSGIHCGILLMPVLPYITDSEENLLTIVQLAKENGARFVYPAFGVTLRQNQRLHFYDKLDGLFPGMKERYIKRYGDSYSCTVPQAKKLYHCVAAECDRLGLLYKMQDIVRSYRQGYEGTQLTFFE